MASTPAMNRTDVLELVRQIQGAQLLNRQLSSICQVNGLKSTGVKADLQRRILDLIQEVSRLNDGVRFYQVKQSIAHAIAQRGGGTIKPQMGRSTVHHSSQARSAQSLGASIPGFNSPGFSPDYISSIAPPPMPSPLVINFKTSPFYRIEGSVGELRICEAMTAHRNSITMPIKLGESHPVIREGATGAYRIMIFCAGEAMGPQEIAFPYQSEIRVNSGEFKANLRGLKNKPGSTRPVDVTPALRLRPNYVNSVEFTYALTTKKFYLVANLCKVFPVHELIKDVSTRRRIPKQSVISDLNKKAQDPDVVATSQVLSLKCPLSYMRLEVPCRGLACKHMQCFDATSYLQLQEQGPQWLCPICNKQTPFDHLAVDEYVKDILENTPKNLEAVTIEPNGQWLMKSEPDEQNDNSFFSAPSATVFADDDEIEISEISFAKPRIETPQRPSPAFGTPSSQNGSVPPRSNGTSSAKRPAPAVIDLTLSSDEDEPDQRPQKRQNTGFGGVVSGIDSTTKSSATQANGYTELSNGLRFPAMPFD